MNLRNEIQNFAKELEEQDNAAMDLWSWLPSYREAKKYHGDYHHEFQPSIADIMKEASTVFAKTKYDEPIIDGDDRQPRFQCPCGETHIVQ
jgi:hypothetical protein